MPRPLDLFYVASHADQRRLADATAVVIDLLRATTTICQALAAGAREVVPLLEIEDVDRCAAELGADSVLRGGERGGVAIAGFDLGNSPPEYTHERVKGRTVLLTTTNGSRAFHYAQGAKRVVAAAAGNLSAVVQSIAASEHLTILCAGTNGCVSREDALIGGAIVHRLLNELPARLAWEANDAALLASDAWHALLTSAAAADRSVSLQLMETIRNGRGGRNLRRIGNEDDVSWCAQIDRWNVVPEWNATRQSLRAELGF